MRPDTPVCRRRVGALLKGNRTQEGFMHAERFRALLTAEGPFASIYFDDSHDTQDAAAQLGLKWRGLREELESQGGGVLADSIERAVLGERPPVGRSGRGGIACA